MPQIFHKFFESKNLQNILITSHENADPDALCSAIAIKTLIDDFYPEKKSIICIDGLNQVCHKIIDYFQLEIQDSPDFQSDGVIIVDTNSLDQLGKIKTQITGNTSVMLIDHHVPHPRTKQFAQFTIINENAIATTEIIYDLYQTFNILPSEKIACLLFLGLLYDSRHLILANNKTIQIINQLLDLGVNYSKMIELLTMPMDRSERIARLKAAQRLIIHEFNSWIVVISHVSAYEASACRALINLGADVALVYGKKKDEIRISARATAEVTEKTNLNLARDIMEKIGPIMQGEGGGHDRAAGCSGIENLEAGLEEALKILKMKLSNEVNSQKKTNLNLTHN